MPELPEVETIVRRTRPLLEGRRVLAFSSRWPRQLLPDPETVRQGVVGRRVERVARRGKYVVLALEGDAHLLVHLRMSGRLETGRDGEPEPPHARAVWSLDDETRLFLCDARKFGRIVYTRHLRAATAHLGVEPLSRAFTRERLAAMLRDRRRAVKPLLLDQSLVAGLGNIYVDEALFLAALHPARPGAHLDDQDVSRLHRAIRRVLREAIEHEGTSFDWVYPGGGMQRRLRVYGRAGEPCARCGEPIAYLRLAQRGTHVCPRCQAL